MPYHVYILFSDKFNKFYIGQTNDLEARLNDHNFSKKTKTFTSKYRPWNLHWSLIVPTRSIAMKIERYLKNKDQDFYLRLPKDQGLIDYITNRFIDSSAG